MLQDLLGVDNGQQITDRIAIIQALNRLDEEEREIVIRRFYKRHTQSSIANDMGMSQVQISRMEKKILKKLKNQLM